MRNHWITKYLPTREAIRTQKALWPVRHLLDHPELWHLHRRSVGGAFFIGLFCAFVPVPFVQMVLAALFAIASRCNLPIAVALVWISNPLTIGPMFYFAYKLGAWLLGVELVNGPWELSWQWFGSQFAAIWWPLTLGCLVCGWVSGLTGAVVSRLLWRFHVIRRWRERRARRALRRVKAAARTAAGSEGSA
ncbi:MAG: DUF2062 domain-containing protein [Gammaproteobacteria bacterium]|nr:DUF2062 domain-containing protein [Gammaproteobacteria bacterium]MDE0444302.1 DUF2062 domain-containing protein [Gammaproteobacteria bacterium]